MDNLAERLEKLEKEMEQLKAENQELRKEKNKLKRKIESIPVQESENNEELSRRSFLKKIGAGAASIGAMGLASASGLKLTKNGVSGGSGIDFTETKLNFGSNDLSNISQISTNSLNYNVSGTLNAGNLSRAEISAVNGSLDSTGTWYDVIKVSSTNTVFIRGGIGAADKIQTIFRGHVKDGSSLNLYQGDSNHIRLSGGYIQLKTSNDTYGTGYRCIVEKIN